MAQRDLIQALRPRREQPLGAGVQVLTPRGYGTVVGPIGDDGFTAPSVYSVELDDDQGRTVVRAADLQVVELVGA